MDRASVAEEIRRKALAAGLDPSIPQRIAWIESKFNPNAKNPGSTASGVFQFINSTGRQYGLSNPFDPLANIDAGIRLTQDNRAGLTRALGREPTAGEMYLAHQQGLGGAIKLLSNPNARAVDVVGDRAVRLNGGTSDMTAGQFAGLWSQKMGDSSQPLVVDVRKQASSPQWGEVVTDDTAGATAGQPAGPMAPEQFRSAVFNSAPVSTNDALDFRLKDDAVQRGQASWDAALKAAGPQITPEQAQLAKLLTGAWA